jgi:hypothetical protein
VRAFLFAAVAPFWKFLVFCLAVRAFLFAAVAPFWELLAFGSGLSETVLVARWSE